MQRDQFEDTGIKANARIGLAAMERFCNGEHLEMRRSDIEAVSKKVFSVLLYDRLEGE